MQEVKKIDVINETTKHRFSLYRLIGTLMFLSIMVGLVVYGGIGFLQIPLILYTFAITFCLLLVTFGKEFIRFIPVSIQSLFATAVVPVPMCAKIATYGCIYVVGAGVCLVLVSFVLIGRADEIGVMLTYLAYASVSLLYSIVGLFFFLIVREEHSGRN